MTEEAKIVYPRKLLPQGQLQTDNAAKAIRKRFGIVGRKASKRFYAQRRAFLRSQQQQ